MTFSFEVSVTNTPSLKRQRTNGHRNNISIVLDTDILAYLSNSPYLCSLYHDGEDDNDEMMMTMMMIVMNSEHIDKF